MGKHSATGGPEGQDHRMPDTGRSAGRGPLPPQPPPPGPQAPPGPLGVPPAGRVPPGAPGTGRRRRGPAEDDDYFAPMRPHDPAGPAGRHPEYREHHAWGAPGAWPADRPARRDLAFDPVEEWAADWAPYDTASAFDAVSAAHAPPASQVQPGRPAPPRKEFVDAFDTPRPPHPAPSAYRADTAGQGARTGAGRGAADASRAMADSVNPSRGRGRVLTGAGVAAALAALAVLAGTHLHRDHRGPEDGRTPSSGPGAADTGPPDTDTGTPGARAPVPHAGTPDAPTGSAAQATADPASYATRTAARRPLLLHVPTAPSSADTAPGS